MVLSDIPMTPVIMKEERQRKRERHEITQKGGALVHEKERENRPSVLFWRTLHCVLQKKAKNILKENIMQGNFQ